MAAREFASAICVLAGSFVVGAPCCLAATETYFSFSSSPASFIGHGLPSYFITPSMGWTFSAAHSIVPSHAPSLGMMVLRARINDPNALGISDWELVLNAPIGHALALGLYEDNDLAPAAGNANLTFSGNARSPTWPTGFFRIKEADFGPNWEIRSFSVDFRQYEVGLVDRWVDGSFRYNATVVPEPGTLAAGVLASTFGLRCSRVRRLKRAFK